MIKKPVTKREYLKSYRVGPRHVTVSTIGERGYAIRSTELPYPVFIKDFTTMNYMFTGLVKKVNDE